MTHKELIRTAKEAIIEECTAAMKIHEFIDDDFAKAAESILQSSGRLILTGIGKSANIASKIVATMNSTGTPAVFMHAADAIHGDLGIVQPEDIVICISKSGNTPEIKVLIPLLKNMGNPIISIVGNTDSFLAQHSDFVLDTTVEKEACPNNLAPTSSTTAQLVMGDALAITLLNARGFSDKDFAKYHPGGALGKKLYLQVEELCVMNEKPSVGPDATIREVILEISSKRLGACAVEEKGLLIGIVTDGDVRRMMEKYADVDNLRAKDIMSTAPKTIAKDTLAVDAFKLMKDNNITQTIVTDNNHYFGIVHLHDILREGIL